MTQRHLQYRTNISAPQFSNAAMSCMLNQSRMQQPQQVHIPESVASFASTPGISSVITSAIVFRLVMDSTSGGALMSSSILEHFKTKPPVQAIEQFGRLYGSVHIHMTAMQTSRIKNTSTIFVSWHQDKKACQCHVDTRLDSRASACAEAYGNAAKLSISSEMPLNMIRTRSGDFLRARWSASPTGGKKHAPAEPCKQCTGKGPVGKKEQWPLHASNTEHSKHMQVSASK